LIGSIEILWQTLQESEKILISGIETWKANRDLTEIAIEVSVTRFNWQRTRFADCKDRSFIHVVEFLIDSVKKRMTSVYKNVLTGEFEVLTKGLSERIMGLCNLWDNDGQEKPSTSESQGIIEKNMEALSSHGLVSIKYNIFI
jgi:magnesium-transporting ATPase (P-type)